MLRVRKGIPIVLLIFALSGCYADASTDTSSLTPALTPAPSSSTSQDSSQRPVVQDTLPTAVDADAFLGFGLLLGLRSDGEDPNAPEPIYDTIWMRAEEGRPAAMLFPQALVWPSASGEQLEALRAFEYRTPEDRIRYVRYERLGGKPQQLGLMMEEHTEEQIVVTEQVTYAGQTGVSLASMGSYWAGNGTAFQTAAQVLQLDQLNTNEGYLYGEVYQKKSRNLQNVLDEIPYKTARKELMQAWDKENPEALSPLHADGTLWSIEHEKGAWKASLYGSYSLPGGNTTLFEDEFPAEAVVPALETGGVIDWNSLTAAYPDARDAVLSPDGSTAVILLHDSIVISILKDGHYSAPLRSWPVRPNTQLVMSRWVEGAAKDTWDDRLQLWHAVGNYGYPGLRSPEEQQFMSSYE